MVAFENLPEKVTDIVLTILVENISGFPSDDFKVEVIRDFGVAVVTFQKPIGEPQAQGGPASPGFCPPHLRVWDISDCLTLCCSQ